MSKSTAPTTSKLNHEPTTLCQITVVMTKETTETTNISVEFHVPQEVARHSPDLVHAGFTTAIIAIHKYLDMLQESWKAAGLLN